MSKDPKDYRPPALNTINAEDKIVLFNKLYDMVMEHYLNVAEDSNYADHRSGEDAEMVFEAAMKGCLGKDIFKHYNKLITG